MLPGARALASSFTDCVNPESIRVKRSARHSNFPECSECQRLRAAYLKIMTTPGASQEVRDRAWALLREHMVKWQSDRSTALSLKDHSSGLCREDCYECDDKCGSQWVEAPVAEIGRDNKSVSSYKFRFGIQCNVVVGGGGVNRFMVVPKHIKTGGNFGLTCLTMAIWRAHQLGRLKGDAGRRLYRHTDGGPDNMNKATHLFHWLLVWLGVFDEIIWFRFDAGHSHTELADRFFSLLKRLFTSMGAERAQGLGSLADLEVRLKATFAKSAEAPEFEYIFANWDLNTWFEKGGLQPDSDFGGISFYNVFRYKYDEACWQHGCVKVMYKRHLAWEGRAVPEDDCEWSPFETVTTVTGKRNCTTSEGVRYVVRPPHVLLQEPPREAFEKDICGAAEAIRKLVKKRDGQPEQLSEASKAHWAALAAVYEKGQRPGTLPDMPCTEGGHTFSGSPVELLPLLKAMRRFPRPLIHWDPFTQTPPPDWLSPDAIRSLDPSGSHDTGARQAHQAAGSSGGLRDPRVFNNVTGSHMTQSNA